MQRRQVGSNLPPFHVCVPCIGINLARLPLVIPATVRYGAARCRRGRFLEVLGTGGFCTSGNIKQNSPET